MEPERGGCSAVSLLQQPQLFAPSRRTIMDPRSRGLAGIVVRLVLVLSSPLGAGGEGERSRAERSARGCFSFVRVSVRQFPPGWFDCLTARFSLEGLKMQFFPPSGVKSRFIQ